MATWVINWLIVVGYIIYMILNPSSNNFTLNTTNLCMILHLFFFSLPFVMCNKTHFQFQTTNLPGDLWLLWKAN